MQNYTLYPDRLEIKSQQSTVVRHKIIVKTEGGKLFEYPMKIDDKTITADLGEFGHYTEKLLQNDNEITGTVSLRIDTNESFIVICPFELAKSGEHPYFMIPGFLYGTNNLANSDGQQPKFNYGGPLDWPNSSMFRIRADRSTHPGVICIKNSGLILVGVQEKMSDEDRIQADKWAPGYFYNGLLLDSSHSENDIIGFSLGYEYAPKRYSWEWNNPKTPENNEYVWGGLENLKGKTLTTTTYYYVDKAEKITDYGKALHAYYNQLHESPRKRADRVETLEKISHMIVEQGWNDEHKYFYQNDMEEGKIIGDIAWTGGMQVAYPLLKAGLKLDNKKFLDIAKEYMDHICENAVNEKAGLLNEEFYKGEWNVTGWWGRREDSMNFGDNPQHSAYLNGQASYYLLKSYELFPENKHWLNTAKMMIDTAIKGQRDDGAYPSLFDPADGTPTSFYGYQSCWFVPGAALLYKITSDEKYLQSAQKAIRFYHSWHLKGELHGTPMDTHDAVDEEGNLAFIIASVELHKILNDPIYLGYARDGLNWEFSWKFAYNTAHSNEPLKSMDWSSCGGSITSSYITTIHQMGSLVCGEMYYLYNQLGDEYIASRLHDTCVWGMGTFNRFDNEFGFGTTGMATEQFFYSDGLCCPWYQPWDGGVWDANLPWAAACVLLSCAEDIPDEFFE